MGKTIASLGTVAALVISACTSAHEVAKPSPKPSVEAIPQPTKQPGPLGFHGESVLYEYNFGGTDDVGGFGALTGTSGIFRTDPSGTYQVHLDDAIAEAELTPSRNGSMIARRTRESLSIASATHPMHFMEIASVTRPNTSISSVAWDMEGKALAYVSTFGTSSHSNPGTLVHSFYLIDADGRNRRLISRVSTFLGAELHAYDSANHHLYWFYSGPGAPRFRLSRMDTKTGSTSRIFPKQLEDITFSFNDYAMTLDFQTLFYSTATEIVEFSMTSGTRRTIYEADRAGLEKKQHREIRRMFLMPDDKEIVFVQYTSPGRTTPSQTTTYRLDLETGYHMTMFPDPLNSTEVMSVSPSGRYMWVEHCSNCYTNGGWKQISPEYLVIDNLTGRESTILRARVDYFPGLYPRQHAIESARFICWLKA